MKKTEFSALLRSWTNNKTGLIEQQKIMLATAEQRRDAMQFIVKHRMPVMIDLVAVATNDLKWLSSMGYLHQKQGTHFKFFCTSENLSIIVEPK